MRSKTSGIYELWPYPSLCHADRLLLLEETDIAVYCVTSYVPVSFLRCTASASYAIRDGAADRGRTQKRVAADRDEPNEHSHYLCRQGWFKGGWGAWHSSLLASELFLWVAFFRIIMRRHVEFITCICDESTTCSMNGINVYLNASLYRSYSLGPAPVFIIAES